MLCEFVDDFITSRNPKINIAVLNEIFKLKWEGVATLTQRLLNKGLQSSVRTFRRIQVLEILSVYLKNLDDKQSTTLKTISKDLTSYVKNMSTTESQKVSVKEFNTLLDVICIAHKKFDCLPKIMDKIQEIRKTIKLDSINNYKRICNLYAVDVIKNCDVSVAKTNGTTPSAEEQEEEPTVNGKEKSAKKRKNSSKQLKKEKKLKKEARLQISSKGFNDSFEFSNNQASVDVDMSDGSAIESEDED